MKSFGNVAEKDIKCEKQLQKSCFSPYKCLFLTQAEWVIGANTPQNLTDLDTKDVAAYPLVAEVIYL